MKTKQPSLGNYFKLPNPGLRAYFHRVVAGQSEDYRTPMFGKQRRTKVLNAWQKIMFSTDFPTKYPGMLAFEMEMKEKVGPLSIMKPLSERMDDVESYYSSVEDAGEPISDEAIADACNFFSGMRGIRLRSRRNTMDAMKKSTNSGAVYFTKRKYVVDETMSGVIHGTIQILEDHEYELCAILGWRGQEGGIDPDDVKQRVVFMMPFLLNLYELQFYQPCIEAVQKLKLIPAYVSMECVDSEVTALFDTKGPDDFVVCTDFKRFDQHFNRNMEDAARRIEMDLAGPECADWFDEIFYIKFNIPLILSEDIVCEGWHGMGSGSGGTNFDESLAHKALQFESARKHNATLNPHSMAYGDDGILTYPGCTAKGISDDYTAHGQIMQLEKQLESKTECIVLRRYHHVDYRVNNIMVGVYSTFRALGRILGQERFYDPKDWGPEMVELRNLSILENCKWHPLFHEFIDFVMSGDKFRLGLDIPGFFKNLASIAKKATEQITDFLGYTKTQQQSAGGIETWEVVKYLKQKGGIHD